MERNKSAYYLLSRDLFFFFFFLEFLKFKKPVPQLLNLFAMYV